jgi:hypothetical protein
VPVSLDGMVTVKVPDVGIVLTSKVLVVKSADV